MLQKSLPPSKAPAPCVASSTSNTAPNHPIPNVHPAPLSVSCYILNFYARISNTLVCFILYPTVVHMVSGHLLESIFINYNEIFFNH